MDSKNQLTAVGSQSSTGNWSTHYHYYADGNGNIMALVNSSQTVAASYRYDPFGNTVRVAGTLALANLYRFSSKEIHINSGMHYYGYRFYDPNLQRWINGDQVGELGFRKLNRVRLGGNKAELNLYAFVRNQPVDRSDSFGLEPDPSPWRDESNANLGRCLAIAKRRLDEYRRLARKVS